MVPHRSLLNFEGAWPPSARARREGKKKGRGRVDIQPDALYYINNFKQMYPGHVTTVSFSFVFVKLLLIHYI
jgi:hypothetical protein